MIPGAVHYLGTGGDAERHAHHAIQVMVSLDKPFLLEYEGYSDSRRIALVPSGESHRLWCDSRRILLLLIDPFGPRGRGLQLLAEHASSTEIEQTLMPVLYQHADIGDPVDVIHALDRVAVPADGSNPPALSAPVRAALHYVERTACMQPRLPQAAAAAQVSPSHLTHLFTRETGIPFRRYVIWVRLRRAVERLGSGANLTEAAVDAGFSDSAHLSRLFKSSFGLTPSTLLSMRIHDSA